LQGSVAATTTQALSVVERAQAWGIDHVPNVIRIGGLLLAAWILSRVARKLIRRLETFADDGDPAIVSEREKRAQTLGKILRQTSFVLIWGVALMAVLGELGVDLKPILAGAGVVGLAVGFGAQTLVKDVISGFFILLENQFRVGDVIETAGVGGLVESINLRTTVLRDIQGRVHVIPNGSINVVSNFTREWSRAVLDIGVAYREDTDRCFEIMKRVGAEMEADPAWGPKIVGAFEYPGVENLADSAVVLRMMAKTVPQERWNVLRELRRRVKFAFDAEGIEIPFPHRTVYMGDKK
jgi:small conductance mechanosensitive channel